MIFRLETYVDSFILQLVEMTRRQLLPLYGAIISTGYDPDWAPTMFSLERPPIGPGRVAGHLPDKSDLAQGLDLVLEPDRGPACTRRGRGFGPDHGPEHGLACTFHGNVRGHEQAPGHGRGSHVR